MDFSENCDRIAQLKQQVSIVAIAGEATKLSGHGNKRTGRCPFPDHEDRNPSFSVDGDKGLYHCHGCKRGGDVIDFVQELYGIDFPEACELLSSVRLPSAPIMKTEPLEKDEERERKARKIWQQASALGGTPAERYLERRALPPELTGQQSSLRFVRLPFDGSARLHPALVAAVRNQDGEVVATQCTFLTEDGQKLAGSCKRSTGLLLGGTVAVRGLEAPDEPDHIHLCEGLEDALSIVRILPKACAMATLGTSNLSKVELPLVCSTVTLANDNDEPGRRAVEAAKHRLLAAGKSVFVLSPPDGCKDWNDYLTYWEFHAPFKHYNELPWKMSNGQLNDEAFEHGEDYDDAA